MLWAEGPSSYKQHALKGQKLIAQGNALGIKAISNAPRKGKSFIYCQGVKSFCLYRAIEKKTKKKKKTR